MEITKLNNSTTLLFVWVKRRSKPFCTAHATFVISLWQNLSWGATRSPASETSRTLTSRPSRPRTSWTERVSPSRWKVSSTCPLLTATITTSDWRTMKESANCSTVTLATCRTFWGTARRNKSGEGSLVHKSPSPSDFLCSWRSCEPIFYGPAFIGKDEPDVLSMDLGSRL